MEGVPRMSVATPAWINRDLRIDPSDLPARFSVPTETGAPASQDASIYLDRANVVWKRRLSGLPLTVALPLDAYEGVAARVSQEEGGWLTGSVELHHRDPALSLPLAVTRDMEQLAGDWRAWSQTLGLPMLLVEIDGTVSPVETVTPAVIGSPQPRRRTGLLTKRRPRFLVRRRPGAAGEQPVLRGLREIIAPD